LEMLCSVATSSSRNIFGWIPQPIASSLPAWELVLPPSLVTKVHHRSHSITISSPHSSGRWYLRSHQLKVSRIQQSSSFDKEFAEKIERDQFECQARSRMAFLKETDMTVKIRSSHLCSAWPESYPE
jgi:hypothetical protein